MFIYIKNLSLILETNLKTNLYSIKTKSHTQNSHIYKQKFINFHKPKFHKLSYYFSLFNLRDAFKKNRNQIEKHEWQ